MCIKRPGLSVSFLGATVLAVPALGQTLDLSKTSSEFSGDFRYRHERIDDQKFNDAGDESTDSRVRQRLRLRLQMDAKINPKVSVTARFASGTADAASTNESLDGGFQSKNAWLDLAYLTYKPVDGAKVLAGKMKNPFMRVGKSQLIWDSDVNPEGATAGYTLGGEGLNLSATAGHFWVNEIKSPDVEDVVLNAGQLAVGFTNSLVNMFS